MDIRIRFQAKKPGPEMILAPVDMVFNYAEAYKGQEPEAYETLLEDVIEGNPTLFMRADQVEAAWKVITPIVEAWQKRLPVDFPGSNHMFDLVLHGMGDNAHTLSLFPGYEVTHEKEHWVRSYYLEEQKMVRITLTAPVVNAASRVVFLVSRIDKAKALHQVLTGERDPNAYPAQIIQPLKDELYWWVDEAAATELE